MKSFFQKPWKREAVIFLFLFLVALVLRLPTLQQPFENDSGTIAYHARPIARGLPLYGEHRPAHYMPGTYYSYAFAFNILGDQVQSVRTVLFLWTTLSVFLIFRLGKIVAEVEAGIGFLIIDKISLDEFFYRGKLIHNLED